MNLEKWMPYWRVTVVFSLVVVLFLLLLFRLEQNVVTPEVALPWVDGLPVKLAAHEPQVRLYGQVRNPSLNALSFKLAGRVEYLSVKAGDRVQAGTKLACLEDTQARYTATMRRHECEALRGSLAIVQAELNQATVHLQHSEEIYELERKKYLSLKSLADKKQIARQAGDDARLAWVRAKLQHQVKVDARDKLALRLDELEAKVSQCEAVLAQAEYQLKEHCIVAPDNGLVADVFVAKGSVVAPGTAVVQFAAHVPFEVRSMILGRHLQDFRKGIQRARLLTNPQVDLQYYGLVDVYEGVYRGYYALFTAKDANIHAGQVHEVLVDLLPISETVLVLPSMIYEEKYVYEVALDQESALLLRRDCQRLGYHWQQGKRYVMIRFTDGQVPRWLLKTPLPQAAEGLEVRLRGVL